MKKSTLTKSGLALAAGTTLALAAALPASAHVSVSASSTAAGSSSILSFTVPHGCDGSPTTRLAIALPEEILSATPTIVAGWDVEKVTAPTEPTSDAHGNEVSERVAEVVYTATDGGLPDGYRQVFELQLQLPELEPGTELGFPVTQGCAEGEEVWDGDALPAITLTAATEGDGHGHDAAEEPAGHDETGDDPAVAGAGDASSPDVLARVLGIGGLAVGAAGLVAAVVARRGTRASS